MIRLTRAICRRVTAGGENLRVKAVTDLAWSGISTAFDGVCGLVLMLLVGNRLPERDLGGYSLAVSVYLLVSMVAPIGSQVATVVYGARTSGDRPAFSSMMTASLLLALGMGILGAGLLAAGAPVAARVLSAPTLVVTLPRMAVGFPCFLVNKVFLAMLNGSRRLRAYACATVVRGLLLMTLTTLGLRVGLALGGAALAFPVTEALLTLGFAASLRNAFDWRITQLLFWIRRLLKLGSGSLAGTIVGQINARLDLFLLSALLRSPDHVGIYSVAAILAQVPMLGLIAFQRVSTPLLSAYWSRRDRDRMEDLTHRLGRAAVLLTGVYAGALSLMYANVIGRLYPGRPLLAGAEAAQSAQILLLGQVVFSAWAPYSGLFVATERPYRGALAGLLALAVNATLNAVWIPRWGVAGAASAAAVSRVVSTMVAFVLAWRVLRVRLWARGYLPLWIAGGMAVGLGALPLGGMARIGVVGTLLCGFGLWGWRLGDYRRPPPPSEARSAPGSRSP